MGFYLVDCKMPAAESLPQHKQESRQECPADHLLLLPALAGSQHQRCLGNASGASDTPILGQFCCSPSLFSLIPPQCDGGLCYLCWGEAALEGRLQVRRFGEGELD